MMRLIAVAAMCAVLLLACVKSEKRTTRKVDASKVTVYEYDASRPGLRVALDVPADLRAVVTERFYVEIDDGVNRYGVPGAAFVPDSSGDTIFYSPRINTPDSGLVALKFQLVGSSEGAAINDSLAHSLRSDQSWLIVFAVSGQDLCGSAADAAECRTYSLSEELRMDDSQKLYMIWRSYPIVGGSE